MTDLDKLNLRLVQALLYLNAYTNMTVYYCVGKLNVISDALSRILSDLDSIKETLDNGEALDPFSYKDYYNSPKPLVFHAAIVEISDKANLRVGYD